MLSDVDLLAARKLGLQRFGHDGGGREATDELKLGLAAAVKAAWSAMSDWTTSQNWRAIIVRPSTPVRRRCHSSRGFLHADCAEPG